MYPANGAMRTSFKRVKNNQFNSLLLNNNGKKSLHYANLNYKFSEDTDFPKSNF